MTQSIFPKVSIVIISWNAKAYLAECLESLKADVYAGPMEIIVVDNASDDGSPQMVEWQFPEVKLICNTENLGFAKANNIGIHQCTGEFIALINSDVHVLKDCITTLVAYCQSRPTVGLVGPFIFGSDGKQQMSCRGAPSLWNMFCRALALDVVFSHSCWFNGYFLGHWNHRTTRSVDILSGCFWLTHCLALEEVGLLDESFFIYGEDMDWCKRFHKAGWDVVFVPHSQAIHYGGASSANSPIRFFVEKQKADAQYWRKHHSPLAVRGYLAISMLHHWLRILGYSLKAWLVRQDRMTHRYKVERSIASVRWIIRAIALSSP
jgi:GT2 family glycosyltransferase